MPAVIYPDVSEHQPPVDDSYNRAFFMFRAVNENGIDDQLVDQNLAWAVSRRASGKVAQFGVYVIPCLAPNETILQRLDAHGVPHDCVVMVDMESWGGQVRGDQSGTCNQLAEALRARQGGRAELVWGYGNGTDFASIWPTRPAWLGLILAGYGGVSMAAPPGLNMIGWQYTNGAENGTGYPSSTPPFGACDHNLLLIAIPPVTPLGGLGGGTPLPSEVLLSTKFRTCQQIGDPRCYAYTMGGMWALLKSPDALRAAQSLPTFEAHDKLTPLQFLYTHALVDAALRSDTTTISAIG